ncbi:MAG TPA: alpha/beta hydrolase-fold protein [Rhizomicrobium sp.]|jgi:hypothetical protein
MNTIETPPEPPSFPLAAVPQTLQVDLTSRQNGRVYRLQIATPLAAAPPDGYPLLCVLDGDMHFGAIAATARLRGYMGELLAAVVVGIGYPEAEQNLLASLKRRNTDLTPSSGGAAMQESVRRQLGGLEIDPFGGADAFLSTIEAELIPFVAREMPLDTSRKILFGHSLGGLFTLHTAFTRPGAFSTYLALSPSIWWDDCAVLSHETGFVDAIADGRATPRLFLGVGEYEQSPEKIPQLPAQEVRKAAMVSNMLALATRLSNIHAPGFDLRHQVYSGQTHMGVATTALSDALEFALANPAHDVA